MSNKLSDEQLEYWHNSVEGDQDVDDEYETTVGEITALLDHITALESELKAAQGFGNAATISLHKLREDYDNFRAQLVEAVRGGSDGVGGDFEVKDIVQLIQTFEPEKV